MQPEDALNDQHSLFWQLQNVARLFLDGSRLEAEFRKLNCFAIQKCFQILLDLFNPQGPWILEVQLSLGIPWMCWICPSLDIAFQGSRLQTPGLKMQRQARCKGSLATTRRSCRQQSSPKIWVKSLGYGPILRGWSQRCSLPHMKASRSEIRKLLYMKSQILICFGLRNYSGPDGLQHLLLVESLFSVTNHHPCGTDT